MCTAHVEHEYLFHKKVMLLFRIPGGGEAEGGGEEEEKKDKLPENPVSSAILRASIRSLSPFRRHSWEPGRNNAAADSDMTQCRYWVCKIVIYLYREIYTFEFFDILHHLYHLYSFLHTKQLIQWALQYTSRKIGNKNGKQIQKMRREFLMPLKVQRTKQDWQVFKEYQCTILYKKDRDPRMCEMTEIHLSYQTYAF